MTVRMLVILATLSGCAKLDYIHQTPAGDRYEIRGYSFGSTSTVDSFSLHSGEDGKDVRIGGLSRNQTDVVRAIVEGAVAGLGKAAAP
jgi:hypothetical protein